MVLVYLNKTSCQKRLEAEGVGCEETKLLNGEYKLRVFCWRYNEEQVRQKIKKLIPNAKFIEVKK